MAEATAEQIRKLRDLASRLRSQGQEVAEAHGSGDAPEGDLKAADLLWFTAQDAADELNRMADDLEDSERLAALDVNRPRS